MQITRVGVVASCSFSCFLVFLICRIHSVAVVGRWRLMLHSHTTHKDSNTTLLLPGWSWPRHSHTQEECGGSRRGDCGLMTSCFSFLTFSNTHVYQIFVNKICRIPSLPCNKHIIATRAVYKLFVVFI